MPVHSPMLWPAIASGTIPSRDIAVESKRPRAKAPAPRISSSPTVVVPVDDAAMISGGVAMPRSRATSSICAANVASMPGKTNASLPPSAARPRGTNHMSRLPRHARPRSSTLRASSRRSGVGSSIANRSAPLVAGVPSSPARSASIESPTSASTSTPSCFDPTSPTADAVPRPVRTDDPDPAAPRARASPCASITTCALIPPKPKALMPARRAAARSTVPPCRARESASSRVPRAAPRNAGSAASRRGGSTARS